MKRWYCYRGFIRQRWHIRGNFLDPSLRRYSFESVCFDSIPLYPFRYYLILLNRYEGKSAVFLSITIRVLRKIELERRQDDLRILTNRFNTKIEWSMSELRKEVDDNSSFIQRAVSAMILSHKFQSLLKHDSKNWY